MTEILLRDVYGYVCPYCKGLFVMSETKFEAHIKKTHKKSMPQNIETKYAGKDTINSEDLTSEFLAKIRADKNNKMGWKKHHKALKKAGYSMPDVVDE